MKKFDINSFTRENINKLKPYSSARDEFQGEASVYLDANENPFNSVYNRYPDPHQQKLKAAISDVKEIQPEQLFLGNGSDEAIDLLIRAFCTPGVDNIVVPQPTYGMYSVSADINDVKVKSCPLTKDFDIDFEALQNTWDSQSKLIFLCSPNNPSGNSLSESKIKRILESFNGIVIIDEAYIDFTTFKGYSSWINEFENLAVLQTLSKAWGLAGIRLGMCIANSKLISILDKIKPPYNINTMTQTVALDAIQKIIQKEAWVKEIVQERELLKEQLKKLNVTKQVFPSDANFLLVKVTDAKGIYNDLVKKGIIVRDRSNVILCDDCIRITVGTKDENRKLIEALEKL
ncbi:MAG TPA: histidinol-phosphate transaminase [Cyclobacteriaceae bacterium]|nr:histidinol-phosphate transaminase [Cyclobacteriaceae bacterium]